MPITTLARPSVIVALPTPFADDGTLAWRVAVSDRRKAEALQSEMSALRAELSRRPVLKGLKRALSQRLAGHGVRYPSIMRPPLG